MHKAITPKDAYEMLKNNDAVLIDVREDDEFKGRHIPFAWSIPLSTIKKSEDILSLIGGKHVIFQCFKGGRGNTACAIFTEKCNTDCTVYNIEGGITAWEEEGLPIVGTPAKKGISIFRQVQIIMGFGIALLTLLGFTVSASFFVAAGLFAMALGTAGLTGWCGLALMLQKMPWNK